MKSDLLYLLICFTSIDLCLAFASEEQQLACLYENGLNNSTDVELFNEFVRSNFKGEFHLEKQFSCAFACVLNAINPEYKSKFYQGTRDIIQSDVRFPSELKKEMTSRLDNCHQQDEGDICKLVYCVQILRSPFTETLVTNVTIHRNK